MKPDTFVFSAPHLKPDEVIDLFRQFYGPSMNAFYAAEQSGGANELLSSLVALAKSQNTSRDGGTVLPATFLRVTVHR